MAFASSKLSAVPLGTPGAGTGRALWATHAGGLFFRFASRNERSRWLDRRRTAITVLFSLRAIIVMLFPAFAMSRSWLSSSGSHVRRAFFFIIPSPSERRIGPPFQLGRSGPTAIRHANAFLKKNPVRAVNAGGVKVIIRHPAVRGRKEG